MVGTVYTMGGGYKGSTETLLVTPVNPGEDQLFIGIKLNTLNCAGDIAAPAHATSGNVVTISEKADYQDVACEIELLFSNDFKTVKITEKSGCSDYHGAGCNFNGSVRKAL